MTTDQGGGDLSLVFGGRDDFALQPVPQDSRTRRALTLLNVLLGIPTALVFFATGGVLYQQFGIDNLVAGCLIVGILISIPGCILTGFAARSGLNSDLASIPAGFGLRGSALTSAIYSGTFIMLFALEADIIASSVNELVPQIPRYGALLLVAALLVALNWHGVASLVLAMAVTLPLFVILLVALIAHGGDGAVGVRGPSGLELDGTVAVVGALMAFVVNATVAADVGRFLGERGRRLGVPIFGIGMQVLSLGGSVMIGAYVAKVTGETNTGIAFVTALGTWGVLAVVVSQSRINLINLYAGSLSLSNFGRRAFNWQPGRNLWALFLAIAGTALAMTHVYAHLLDVLTFEAVFTCGWVGILTAAVVRRRLSTKNAGDFTSVKSVDSAGIFSLVVTLVIAMPLAFGYNGERSKGLAPVVALLLGFLIFLAFDRFLERGGGRTSPTPTV